MHVLTKKQPCDDDPSKGSFHISSPAPSCRQHCRPSRLLCALIFCCTASSFTSVATWALCICTSKSRHQLINTHTRTHTCGLHIPTVDWPRIEVSHMLIHNAGRIYGNWTLTACLSVMLTSSPAAVAPRPLLFLFFFHLPLHVSRSPDMWGTLIAQLLAQSFSFSLQSLRPLATIVFGSTVIRCSLYFLFLQNLFSWLE